jgi:transposase InsO family protein
MVRRKDKGRYNSCSMHAFRLIPVSHSKIAEISEEAKKRLRWFDYYNCHQKKASLTCRYFGISRKTFYKWFNRYNPYDLNTLEDRSRAPNRRRQREISFQQQLKIRALRKKYIRYGKEKLKILYEREYKEKISSWKIQKTIEKYELYWHPIKNEKLRKKRRLAQRKKRITELKTRPIEGFFFQVDTVVIWWNNIKRYIFTAIDKNSKLSFARMYEKANSFNAREFLHRLWYLVDGKIVIVQSDNGSEFAKLFEEACMNLGIEHYYSRVRTPLDNSMNERFNRTLKEEFIQLGNFYPEPELFNPQLTEWLVEYNFNRPHQSLGYLTPIEFLNGYQKVLPMYPSSTIN